MSAIYRDSSRVDFYGISAVESPRGSEPCGAGMAENGRNPCSEPLITGHPGGRPFTYSAEPLFKEEDRCPACGALILSDAHRLFIFYHSPADIENARVMGGTPAEWRPSAEETPIPGDYGPARVAYWHNEAPTVQVHEGDDDGMWTPCSSYTVTREGLPYSMWMCRRDHVSDPCDEEYLRSISS